jgi:hypothetical protein
MMRIMLAFVLFASLNTKTIAQLPQCDGGHFPMLLPDGSKGGSPSCCQKDVDFFLIGSGNRLGHRQIGQLCSKIDPSTNSVTTNCTDRECTVGPCGASIVGAQQADSNRVIRIFQPKSNPQLCGTQVIVNGQAISLSGSIGPPQEPYVDQPIYPAVTASCPYTTCIAGGIPAVWLKVIAVTHNATGHVESEPAGISLSGAGESPQTAFPKDPHSPPPHPQIAILEAEPKGPHARVVFSGDCTNNAGFGQKARCDVPLVPNPTVTVTYDCQDGFTCEPN